MKKIYWYANLDSNEDVIEISDDLSGDEVEALIKENILGYIDWGWYEVEGGQ